VAPSLLAVSFGAVHARGKCPEEEAEFAFEVEPAVARAHELRELVDRST
jgi:hypothetical protein